MDLNNRLDRLSICSSTFTRSCRPDDLQARASSPAKASGERGRNEAVEAVATIVEEARSKSERHIVFVTGVPGAGKTLTGLQLVYTLTLKDDSDRALGVFLSGNGPLVAVLQYALRGKERARLQADPSRVFVRDVLAFVRDHIAPEAPLPPEHVWVYDEAQRAWDENMVAEKHRHQMSEPEMFLRTGRTNEWMVGHGRADRFGTGNLQG